MKRRSKGLLRRQRKNPLCLCLALALLCLIGLRAQAQEQSFAVINAGVSAAEDAPFVSPEYRFLSGDNVYVTFQIAGFKVRTNETTEVRQIELAYTVTLQDETGVPMADPVADEIKEQLSAEDKNWVPKRRASFVIPPLVSAGEYRIHITAKDLLGAVDGAADVSLRLTGERVKATSAIEVENFRFLRQEDSRDALAIAAYRPGDTVFTQFDIVGFQRAAGNKYHVSYGIAVQGPNGKPFLSETRMADISDASFYPAQFLPERADVVTKLSSLPGEYAITLTVQDLLSHKGYTLRQIFTLE